MDAELDAQIRALRSNDYGFMTMLRELVAHVAIVAANIPDPDAALTKTLQGLEELDASLARLSEFLLPPD